MAEYSVAISINSRGKPPGYAAIVGPGRSIKVADAAVSFQEGALAGMVLSGFVVWRRQDGSYGVTPPSFQVRVGGDYRTIALLASTERHQRRAEEPSSGWNVPASGLRDAIIEAYRNA